MRTNEAETARREDRDEARFAVRAAARRSSTDIDVGVPARDRPLVATRAVAVFGAETSP